MADKSREFFDPKKRRYPENLSGHFLISELELADPNFVKTVVLIITHDEHGAFGLVVNRRAEATLGDIVPEFADRPAAAVPVFVGGPVEQQYIFLLHGGLGGESEGAHQVAAGVVFEPSFDAVAPHLMDAWTALDDGIDVPVHLYAGYSGWGPGQLEGELEHGAWLVIPARKDLVFHADPEAAWTEAFGSLGELYRIAAETGYRPSLN